MNICDAMGLSGLPGSQGLVTAVGVRRFASSKAKVNSSSDSKSEEQPSISRDGNDIKFKHNTPQWSTNGINIITIAAYRRIITVRPPTGCYTEAIGHIIERRDGCVSCAFQ